MSRKTTVPASPFGRELNVVVGVQMLDLQQLLKLCQTYHDTAIASGVLCLHPAHKNQNPVIGITVEAGWFAKCSPYQPTIVGKPFELYDVSRVKRGRLLMMYSDRSVSWSSL